MSKTPITTICILIGGPTYYMPGVNGENWPFEMHPYMGPCPLTLKRHQPMDIKDEPRLRKWLSQKKRIAEVWGVRDTPARDGSFAVVRCFELTVTGVLNACDGSDVL